MKRKVFPGLLSLSRRCGLCLPWQDDMGGCLLDAFPARMGWNFGNWAKWILLLVFFFPLRLFYQNNSMPTHVLISPAVLPCNGNLPRFLTVWSGSLSPHKRKDFLLPKIPLCLLWPAYPHHTTHFGLTSRLALMLVCNFTNFVIKVFIFLPPSACSGLAILPGTPPSHSPLSLLSTSVFILWFSDSPCLASLVMECSNNKTGGAELQSRLDIYKLGSLGQFPDSSASQLTHLSSKDHDACLAEEHLKFQCSALCQWRRWSDVQKYKPLLPTPGQIFLSFATSSSPVSFHQIC